MPLSIERSFCANAGGKIHAFSQARVHSSDTLRSWSTRSRRHNSYNSLPVEVGSCRRFPRRRPRDLHSNAMPSMVSQSMPEASDEIHEQGLTMWQCMSHAPGLSEIKAITSQPRPGSVAVSRRGGLSHCNLETSSAVQVRLRMLEPNT